MLGWSGIIGRSVLVVSHGPSRTIRWSASVLLWAGSLASAPCCCCCCVWEAPGLSCWPLPLRRSFVERARICEYTSELEQGQTGSPTLAGSGRVTGQYVRPGVWSGLGLTTVSCSIVCSKRMVYFCQVNLDLHSQIMRPILSITPVPLI